MSNVSLPPPINGTEAYLAALLDRLGEVLDRMPERPSTPDPEPGKPQTVELREPASKPDQPEAGPQGEPILEPAPPAPSRTSRKRQTKKGGP